ncbi:hypothetical protein [Janibacter sp. LM]|uniref:hypothetical protein n=1 Tax=Janibacter sp. LM TaxID=3144845 RepID=UPI0031F6541D
MPYPYNVIKGLSIQARLRIVDRGLTLQEYVHYFSGWTTWHGDTCGCPDDRCRGFHHDEDETWCGCLTACLDDVVRHRAADDHRDVDGEDGHHVAGRLP